VYDLQRGTTPLRLLATEKVGFPVWHPDGKRMAVELERDGFNVIAMISTDGTSEPEVIYADPQKRGSLPTGFSPDGSELLISMDTPDPRTTDVFVLTMPREPGHPAEIRNLLRTPADRLAARFSPDGKLVAYASSEAGRSDIYVQDYPSLSRKLPISTDGGGRPTWSSDGSTIFYQNNGSLYSVRLGASSDLTAGKPLHLVQRLPFGRYDTAPDGSRFVMVRVGDWTPPSNIFVVLHADAETRDPAH
jgi:Tol biopolymer transport system component